MKATLFSLPLFLVAPLINGLVQTCQDTVRTVESATPARVSVPAAPKCDAACPAAAPAKTTAPAKSASLPPGAKLMFM